MFVRLVFGLFGSLDSFLRNYTENSILLALAFFGIISLVSTLISLPFSYYSTFVIEEKFGFNKMTRKLFFADMAKSLLLSAIIGAPLLALMVWLYALLGSKFWVSAWIVATAFSLFMMMFYSSLIVPLFNKQTPLEK